MALQLYLAMTGSEILENGGFPPAVGWFCSAAAMAELPGRCPDGGMLILTDEQPFPEDAIPGILEDLDRLVQSHRIESVLMDFQRPGNLEAKAFVQAATGVLGCPMGVSANYAADVNCAVVLPPVPHDIPVEEYLRPWQGREIWLEAAMDGMVITVTEDGAKTETLLRGQPGDGEQWDRELNCHYRLEIGDSAVFTLRRTQDDLRSLLQKAEMLGVTRAVGLYQELKDIDE